MIRKITALVIGLLITPQWLMAAQDVVVYRADGTPKKDPILRVSGVDQEQTAFERIFWNKTPVSITLKTGRERLIHFPEMVRVKPPQDKTPDEIKISVGDNVVYIKALKSFSTARMRVQSFNHTGGSFDGGVIYLLDLSAHQRGGTEQIQIIDKAHSTSQGTSVTQTSQPMCGALSQTSQTQSANVETIKKVDMVELVRYVSQQLYAPERLMPSHTSIYRTPLRVKSLKSLYRGGELPSTPLASWQGSGLYVTAVKLQNQTNRPLTLDPRLFRGQWRSRTLQHTGLSQYHSESDTTTVYLVSDRPFHESLWF